MSSALHKFQGEQDCLPAAPRLLACNSCMCTQGLACIHTQVQWHCTWRTPLGVGTTVHSNVAQESREPLLPQFNGCGCQSLKGRHTQLVLRRPQHQSILAGPLCGCHATLQRHCLLRPWSAHAAAPAARRPRRSSPARSPCAHAQPLPLPRAPSRQPWAWIHALSAPAPLRRARAGLLRPRALSPAPQGRLPGWASPQPCASPAACVCCACAYRRRHRWCRCRCCRCRCYRCRCCCCRQSWRSRCWRRSPTLSTSCRPRTTRSLRAHRRAWHRAGAMLR